MSETVSEIIMERNVPATMRDGTVLRADVYRPVKKGKYPVLLQRTPYNKEFLPYVTMVLDPLTAAHAGYVVVIQDVRGRFASDGGPYYMYRDEFRDGYDSVEWAATLPYSDDNVGMFGLSYMGMTQFQAALLHPPHLKTIFPVTWGTDVFLYRGGAFELGLAFYWALGAIGPDAILKAKKDQPDMIEEFLRLVHYIDNLDDLVYSSIPLKEAPWFDLGGGFARFMKDILDHDRYDEFHQDISVRFKGDQLKVPAFCVAGWNDALLGQNLEHFRGIKNTGGSDLARDETRLMIGPWAHAGFLPYVGELDYGLSTSSLLLELKRGLTTLHLQWFDYWLKGIENGITDEAPVKIFIMGKNQWRDEQEWPLARTEYTNYYFHSGGKANARHGDGHLSTVMPVGEEPDRFTYDPHNPVPTRGGNILMAANHIRGPVDQTTLENRDDILVYTTEPLEKEVEVTGPVKVRLFAASSATDTDFTAKLVDVFPDGRIYNLLDGIIRARYRNGYEDLSLIKPEEVYEYEIDLWATSNLFFAGHRIGVEISSSNFPRFDRNPNTGELGRDSSELVAARQTVFHNDQYPSHIILPVIPR
ncbi:MAG: CocE/NonD family hydrolase [Desulfobacterales bacterium]|nr:CocE/NonD family hydrolase [Desulfobacterales bacterium]MBL7225729.1 CocE/NonD family hydrolase [Desulfobacteraceae bacterium]